MYVLLEVTYILGHIWEVFFDVAKKMMANECVCLLRVMLAHASSASVVPGITMRL